MFDEKGVSSLLLLKNKCVFEFISFSYNSLALVL